MRIETRQDPDSSGHRRMCLTIEIVVRIGAKNLDAAAVPDRNLTRKHVGCERRTLADAKESESWRAVGAGVGSIAKMTVDLQQPTAAVQREPSPSPFSEPTSPMQEPTPNTQNEQMDPLMETGGSIGTQRANGSATE